MSQAGATEITSDDHLEAAWIASAAGDLLLETRAELDEAGTNADALRAKADRRSHELITSALAAAHPQDAILSEEGGLDPQRVRSSRVWVVDPLDGTHEFGEPGRTDWAVHVALVVDGAPTVGAVCLPARGRTFTTDSVPALPPVPERRLRLVVSRTRPPAIAPALAQRLDADLIPMGSAGAKAMAVLLGEADIYFHSGGQYEWDSAAPAAVALAAGLHASRLDGSPLRYNRPSAWLPDLLICRPGLTDAVFGALSHPADAPSLDGTGRSGGALRRDPCGPVRAQVNKPMLVEDLVRFLRSMGFVAQEVDYATIEIGLAGASREEVQGKLGIYLAVWQATNRNAEALLID